MPLALWGYISTKEMLLFYTFLSLIAFNIIISIIIYFVIVKSQSKELKLAYESLSKTIEHLKEQLESLAETVIGFVMDRIEAKELSNKSIKKKK